MSHPSTGTVGPLRRGAVRLAIVLGAIAVGSAELLSAFDALNRWSVAAVWLVALALSWRLWPGLRTVPGRLRDRFVAGWLASGRGERMGIVALVALILADLVVALLAEPNNYDSQTYHLPKIEHWVANGNVGFFPTAIHRQDTLPPGAEYLLLQLRLLTGGDALYNLVQFAALLLCLAAASRVAGQLGGGRRAQLLTALLIGSTPMVVLQASSTQTDLIVAGWVVCLATLVLDGVTRRSAWVEVVFLGLATGVIAASKTTGLLAAGPLLLIWGVAQLRQRQVGRTVAGSLAVVAIAGLLAGPYLVRMTVEFGDPLGPPQLRTSIPSQRHDPPAVLVNALRIGQTALDTPWTGLRNAAASATGVVADLVGVELNDPGITFSGQTFPVRAWYPDEDRVSFPVAGLLALLAVALALVRRRSPGLHRAYAGVIAVGFILYSATIKWQPWGNRLLLFLLMLAVPLAGVWLEGVLRRRPRVAPVVAVVVGFSLLAGVLAVGYGFPRRLVGTGSVFTTSPDETRFLRRPQWLPDYRWAAARVDATGEKRVGLIQSNDDWEYPWWVLLPGREIVAVRSSLPSLPAPPADSVRVIICTAAENVCRATIPATWTYARQGKAGVATAP